MPSNIKHRLWSQLWDPRSLSSKLCRNSKFVDANCLSTKRFFSGARPTSKPVISRKVACTKSLTTGSILFFDLGPGGPASSSAATSTNKVEKTIYSSISSPRTFTVALAQQVWRREVHSLSRKRGVITSKRNKSSTSGTQNGPGPPPDKKGISNGKKPEDPTPKPSSPAGKYLHLPHMPKMPHAPSKEELLAAATGFWSRMKVRFKWFSIRSSRPWNIDDWSAFVSWFVLGNIAWIFIGTTTFFSLVIFSINTVVAQGMSVFRVSKATANSLQKLWLDGLETISQTQLA